MSKFTDEQIKSAINDAFNIANEKINEEYINSILQKLSTENNTITTTGTIAAAIQISQDFTCLVLEQVLIKLNNEC